MEWKLLDVEQITHNRFLNYFILHYELDGKPYIYYLASRKSKEELRVYHVGDKPRPDAVIMLLKKIDGEEERIAIIEEYRPAFNAVFTGLPAGLLDEGEDAFMAAVREAREEIGVNISHLSMIMPPAANSEGMSDELVCGVEGIIDSFCENEREFNEDISFRLCSYDEIASMLSEQDRLFSVPARLILENCLIRRR